MLTVLFVVSPFHGTSNKLIYTTFSNNVIYGATESFINAEFGGSQYTLNNCLFLK